MGLSLSICRFNRFDVFTFVLLVWSFNTMILGKEWRLWLIAPRHFLYVRHLLFICFSKMHTFLCHNYCFWHKKRQNCDEFQIFLNFFLFSSNFNLCMHHAPLDTALYLWLVPHWHVLIRCPVLDNILLLPFFHYEQKLKRLLLQFLLLLYSAHHMDMYILIVGVDWNIFPTGDKFWKLFDQDIRVLMIKMYSLSVTSGTDKTEILLKSGVEHNNPNPQNVYIMYPTMNAKWCHQVTWCLGRLNTKPFINLLYGVKTQTNNFLLSNKEWK